MPTIVAANESSVQINEKPVDGVRSIEYSYRQARENIYALGSAERIGIISGPQLVEGRMTVVSSSPVLNDLATDAFFTLIATLRHGTTTMTVSIDDCFLLSKSFTMGVGGVGEAEYRFTATRVREKVTTA
jgi:hypothetical protein